MNRKEYLLTVASEECSEIAQAISKALRFGLDDCKPNTALCNSDKIMEEYYDLKAMIIRLQAEGYLPKIDKQRSEFMMAKKIAQVEAYITYSKDKGCIE
jgi:hypothetical protein